MSTELNTPISAGSFYLELAGVCEGERSIFKSVTIPDYQPKVQGGEQPIGSTKGGKSERQINTAGFEGLFSFDCVCIGSKDAQSTSKKMYKWFEKCLPATAGGKGKWEKVSGSLTLYNSDSKMTTKWDFAEAWPSKYKCADFDVTGDSYLEETYTITCEKWNRVK